MPVTDIFQTLRTKVAKSHAVLPHEKRAMFWFSKFSEELKNWQRNRHLSFNAMSDDQHFQQSVMPYQAEPGFLYFFLYDPKHGQTLPYYDQFPMILVLDAGKDSFLGLNFHYLDYYYRAAFFDALYTTRDSHKMALSKADALRVRLRATYDILQVSKKYRMFKPCLKRYLFSHVKSPLLQVGMQDWDLALFLPVESFVKESKQTVWDESEQMF